MDSDRYLFRNYQKIPFFSCSNLTICSAFLELAPSPDLLTLAIQSAVLSNQRQPQSNLTAD